MTSLFKERTLTALCLLVIGIALISTTFGLTYSSFDGVFSPMFFPRIILSLWVGLALLALLAEVLKPQVSAPLKLGRTIAVAVVVLLYCLNLMAAGFFLSSVLFCVITLLLLGLRGPVQIVGFSLGVPGALVVLFNHVLSIPLPTSPFTYYF